MQASHLARRDFLTLALVSLCGAAAQALEPPAGKIILTVAGVALPQRNAGDGTNFDLAMLEALPGHGFATRTPWFTEPHRFTGVLLRELLRSLGAPLTGLHATALNDYRVDIPASDIADEDVMLAYRLDGETMAVRDKGPLVIIYPFDANQTLRNAVHYSRAIWQLRRLELQ